MYKSIKFATIIQSVYHVPVIMNKNLYNSSSAFLSSSRISTICFANNSNNSIFLATILTQAIQALWSTAVFLQRFSFITVSLVHCLHEISPGWIAKENFLKFRSPYCQKMHLRHSFWLQKHSLYIVDKLDFFSWE